MKSLSLNTMNEVPQVPGAIDLDLFNLILANISELVCVVRADDSSVIYACTKLQKMLNFSLTSEITLSSLYESEKGLFSSLKCQKTLYHHHACHGWVWILIYEPISAHGVVASRGDQGVIVKKEDVLEDFIEDMDVISSELQMNLKSDLANLKADLNALKKQNFEGEFSNSQISELENSIDDLIGGIKKVFKACPAEMRRNLNLELDLELEAEKLFEQKLLLNSYRKHSQAQSKLKQIKDNSYLADFSMIEEIKSLPHNKLSARELQVFKSIGRGYGLTQIADDMSLSVKTVSTYRQRILEKMKMESNADVVKYVLVHHLFQ
jgi:DNA-binding NarL/FixJ family response regulator